MGNPYKTRDGGATVTVFVPYDCSNKCPFCINKQEYVDTTGFSETEIIQSIRFLNGITPRCDFAFTGGEPLANLDSLQRMLDEIPTTHRIFINTTVPVFHNHTEDEVVSFLNRNAGKITCLNISRHLYPFVEESNDAMLDRVQCAKRINCVLFGNYTREKLTAFIARFRAHNIPIQFRSDYTKTTPENLFDEAGDGIFRLLSEIHPCTFAEGCRIRCNYEFNEPGMPVVSYHKTLPYSTMHVTEDGIEYDLLYDIIIKQSGAIHSDWTGTLLDRKAYEKVAFEPYDLQPFAPGSGTDYQTIRRI